MINNKEDLIEIINVEEEGLVCVTDFTKEIRNFKEAKDFYNKIIEVDTKMSEFDIYKNADRKRLKRYWLVINNLLEKHKETLYQYIKQTHKNSKDDIEGVKIDKWKNWNKEQRDKIDNCKDDLEAISNILIDVEKELMKFKKVITKQDKKNIDRIYSVIIYGHDKIRKIINRKHTNGANPPLHQSKKELVMIRRAKTKKTRYHECDWKNKKVNNELIPKMEEEQISKELIDLIKTHVIIDPTRYKKSKLVKGINRLKKACLEMNTKESEYVVDEVNKFFKVKTGIQAPFTNPTNDKYKQPKDKNIK